jgi:predicted DNA-binding transcriptional regulator AlpA
MPAESLTQAVPIGIDAHGVATLLGISQSHFFGLLRAGRFGPEARRLGRAKRYDRIERIVLELTPKWRDISQSLTPFPINRKTVITFSTVNFAMPLFSPSETPHPKPLAQCLAAGCAKGWE